MGVTPGQAVPDMSPVKVENRRDSRNGIDRHIMSSSPPPMDAIGSPSKAGPGRGSQVPSSAVAKRESSYHPGGGDEDTEMRSRSASAAAGTASMAPIKFNANANPKAQFGNGGPVAAVGNDEDDDGEDGGFDLAKGFAPITGMRRPGSVNAR